MTSDLLGFHEIPFEDVKRIINGEFRRLWQRFFGGHPGLTPGALAVLLEEVDAGYSQKDDRLVIPISFHDLMGTQITKPECDPPWLSDLVHEMVHEYQVKVVAGAATAEGRKLRTQYKALYPQAEHDESFFTGVPLFAEGFGKSIKVFVEWIAPCFW